MKQPRDVIRPEVDCMEQADAIIEALGRAGYEIVQRYEEPKSSWWSLFFPVFRQGEQVVMAKIDGA